MGATAGTTIGTGIGACLTRAAIAYLLLMQRYTQTHDITKIATTQKTMIAIVYIDKELPPLMF